jgi:hypothetical protein
METIPLYKELDIYFRNVDHADVKAIDGEVDLREFISGMLCYNPRWISVLYHVREYLVKLLGLVRHEKPEMAPIMKPETIPFEPDRKASFFTVRQAKEELYWVAETPPDKHLKAWFGIVVETLGGGVHRFYVFTTVKYIHWTGLIYFNLIRPFHHLVVWRMMRAGIDNKVVQKAV